MASPHVLLALNLAPTCCQPYFLLSTVVSHFSLPTSVRVQIFDNSHLYLSQFSISVQGHISVFSFLVDETSFVAFVHTFCISIQSKDGV